MLFYDDRLASVDVDCRFREFVDTVLRVSFRVEFEVSRCVGRDAEVFMLSRLDRLEANHVPWIHPRFPDFLFKVRFRRPSEASALFLFLLLERKLWIEFSGWLCQYISLDSHSCRFYERIFLRFLELFLQ